MGAKIPVKRLPDRVVIFESKADPGDRRGWDESRQNQAGEREELDRARADLAEHVGIGPQLAGWKDRDLDATRRFVLDRVGHFLRARVHGVRRGQVVRVLVLEFGLGLSPGAAQRHRQCDRAGAGPGQQVAS